MPAFNLFKLPSELIYIVVEHLPPSSLTAFAEISPTTNQMSTQAINALTADAVIEDYKTACKENNHSTILRLLPFILPEPPLSINAHIALLYTCRTSCGEAVNLLARKGIPLHEHSARTQPKSTSLDLADWLDTPFLSAARNTTTDALKALFANGASLSSIAYFTAGSPSLAGIAMNPDHYLHHAASEGLIAVVKWLLVECPDYEDVDIDVPDFLKRTPLMFAAFTGKVEMVRTLLALGANAWQCDFRGWDAQRMAVQNEEFEVVKVLSAHKHALTRGRC
ncbi:hypothetical protein ASPVEDRAFT_83980 [Aspergillus versicolor CBS 583.65]|uniref:F-box domain-containing protein n=1 Tax=Aspergillus versicolor CBS 583.65 TaxID=1036611 RepID=A0A1L9PM42_ASPVE|nr:uncharacterized protein ASPVEDRAFT_83980 [Aspergillus versicolor CBS 583.65]OJJ02485.1 hypothetical protein ASPVEDRAFT_83980 [Aspergillus versicolor CBS 583.65]